MKIAVGISFYGNYSGLARLLPTISGKDKADIIFAIDGKYKGFPEYYIDDKEKQEIKKLLEFYNAKYYLIDSLYEWQKRQTYLDLCKTYSDIDILIVIDSDEYVIGDWPTFRRNCNIISKHHKNKFHLYSLQTHSVEDNTQQIRPRVIFEPQKVRYNNRHWQLALIGSDYALEHKSQILGIEIIHDAPSMPKDYLAKEIEYKKYLRDMGDL